MSDIDNPKPYPSMQARTPQAPKAKTPQAKALGGVTSDSALPPDDQEALNLKIAELRAKRVPFGGHTQKLAYAKRPGYRRHWFADHPGRIEEARAAGWEHVKDREEKTVSKLHGRHRDGRAMIGYLMEIPEVLWREDLARTQQRVDENEAAIQGGQVPQGVTGEKQGSFYVPGQGISIKNEAKR